MKLTSENNISTFELVELFKIFKTKKFLYRNLLVLVEIQNLVTLYIVVVEKGTSFESNSKIVLENEKNKEELNLKCDKYIQEYFEAESTRHKRTYRYENAGLSWSESDIRKFNEGMKIYGHCQLANVKISKYMGSHIEASHVKLFRSLIFKEKRLIRKSEKEAKIIEMKKDRKLKWKLMK